MEASSANEEYDSLEYTPEDSIFYGEDLVLDLDSFHSILNDIDFFVSESRGNKSVTDVSFAPYSGDDQDDEVWDKLGQAL